MRICEDLEFVSKFCECIKLGMSIKAACKGMKISHATMSVYIKTANEQLAENPEATSPEITLLNLIKNAEREFESDNLNVIKQAAVKGDWKAAAWLLERRRAEDYAIKTDMNIGAKSAETGATKITVEYVDPNKDVKRIEEMEKQLDAGA